MMCAFESPFAPEELQGLYAAEKPERYFNAAGFAQTALPVREAMDDFLRACSRDPRRGFTRALAAAARCKETLAEMTGGTAAEIALTHHTAEGVNILAHGLDWKPGDKILTLDREYPSTMYVWMHLERTKGVELVLLPEKNGRLDEEEIIAGLERERPRLFAISAVEWCSGWRFDLKRLGRACRELGILFFVDAAQSLGFWEHDVRGDHVEAMAGSAWKWLLGPVGMGFLYMRHGLLDEVRPVFVGSMSVVDPLNFLDYDLTFQPDMRRFEYSTPNAAGLVWFDAALQFLKRLGMDRIRDHVFALQDYAAGPLREMGAEVRGVDADRTRRSGIMAFRFEGVDSTHLAGRLTENTGAELYERDGCVRLSFHVYSTPEGVDAVLDETRRALDDR